MKLKSTETDLVEFSPDKRIHRQVSWYAIHSQRPLDLPAFSCRRQRERSDQRSATTPSRMAARSQQTATGTLAHELFHDCEYINPDAIAQDELLRRVSRVGGSNRRAIHPMYQEVLFGIWLLHTA